MRIPLPACAWLWTSVLVLTGVSIAAPAAERLARLQAVPFNAVTLADDFWRPKQETNRIASVAVNLDQLEKAGNVQNFRLAAEGKREGYSGPVFMDSDLYKGLEAASYTLATHPDPALDRRLDEIIAVLAAAQQPDGYLNTHFQVVEPDKKWTNLRDWHELYCAGHLFEAAVAHHRATGKTNLLTVAVRFADLIDQVFGEGPGQRMGYPGHPETELALIKLWQVTGQQRYFDLAEFFVRNRGRQFFAEEHNIPRDRYDGSYWQDDVPICDHRNIKGHAVRAAYLLSGVVDVAGVLDDPPLLEMVDRVWRNTARRNLYVTGGIGPSAHNEGFTVDYDLPNLSAYQETCASVAMVLWNHRLALLYGDAQYLDVLERALYNGVLAGVSHDGERFFYVNPLESRGTHHRSGWFGCACCPPNVARTLASLGGYAYATGASSLWVNLYIQGSVQTTVAGQEVQLSVKTDYPWEGKVRLEMQTTSAQAFEIRLRIPGWCVAPGVKVNGRVPDAITRDRGYLVFERAWRKGDRIDLELPMPVQRMVAHPRVTADAGLVALQRGPLVYCLEQVDQVAPLDRIALPPESTLEAKRSDLLGGMTVLSTRGVVAPVLDWRGKLYQPAGDLDPVRLTAIPYFAWDNRAPGPMKVWLPQVPPAPPAVGPEGAADLTLSFLSGNAEPEGVRDGVEPKSSGEQPASLCHWWPHKGTEEWVQYTWTEPRKVRAVEVYWFDDTGRGACRLPQSAAVERLVGDRWLPVTEGPFPIRADQWCRQEFAPIEAGALRLRVQLQPDWAAGVHEWRVIEED